MSGVCAGLMSGIHRYFYNPAGFTSFACGIGTFGFGVFGAVSYRLFARRGRRTLDLILLTVAAELMQAALILLLSKPFFAALALEKAILLPKMIVNSVGLVAFMRILDRLNRDLTIELVEPARSGAADRAGMPAVSAKGHPQPRGSSARGGHCARKAPALSGRADRPNTGARRKRL